MLTRPPWLCPSKLIFLWLGIEWPYGHTCWNDVRVPTRTTPYKARRGFWLMSTWRFLVSPKMLQGSDCASCVSRPRRYGGTEITAGPWESVIITPSGRPSIIQDTKASWDLERLCSTDVPTMDDVHRTLSDSRFNVGLKCLKYANVPKQHCQWLSPWKGWCLIVVDWEESSTDMTVHDEAAADGCGPILRNQFPDPDILLHRLEGVVSRPIGGQNSVESPGPWTSPR